MAYEAVKTEHAGPKRGRGAFWGRKSAAKEESNRVRRETDKELIRNAGDCALDGGDVPGSLSSERGSPSPEK